MNIETKRKIVAAMRQYQENKQLSQRRFGAQLGLSSAHINAVMNPAENWDGVVSEDVWRKLKARFLQTKWKVYETVNFRAIQKMCHHAQEEGLTICISDYTGAGKTWALKAYADKNPGAYYVACNQLMSNKEFIREMQRTLGISVEGTAYEMLMAVINEVQRIGKPEFLFDEVDKLKDSCLMTLKVMFDNLEGKCAFVTVGSEVLKEKIHKFALKNKLGYREFKRRFANYTKGLQRFDSKNKKIRAEIVHICQDQGIEDPSQIEHIISHADNYGALYDLVKEMQRLNAQKEAQEAVNHEEAELAEA